MENFSYSYCQASCDITGSSKEWDSHFLQSQLRGLKYSDNRISWLVQQQQMLHISCCLQKMAEMRLLVMDQISYPPAFSGRGTTAAPAILLWIMLSKWHFPFLNINAGKMATVFIDRGEPSIPQWQEGSHTVRAEGPAGLVCLAACLYTSVILIMEPDVHKPFPAPTSGLWNHRGDVGQSWDQAEVSRLECQRKYIWDNSKFSVLFHS